MLAINLHNDLLGCVESNEKANSFTSKEVKCSLPQLKEGQVFLDILTIAAITLPGCSKKGLRQLELYQKLLHEHSPLIQSVKEKGFSSQKIHFMLAIENASSLIEEDEPLELFFNRFEKAQNQEQILYISLTWNQENRFGGGNKSSVGLKEDGKEILRFLHGKKIAIDLSHTSDALAYDLLNLMEKENLQVPLMASHSNFRSVCDVKRNLPDELIKILIQKKGLMGLNFVRQFIGDKPEKFIDHIEKAFELGAEDHLALGADFFGGFSAPAHLCTVTEKESYFFDQYPDESCFPSFFNDLRPHFSKDFLEKLAHKNALDFFKRHQILRADQLDQIHQTFSQISSK